MASYKSLAPALVLLTLAATPAGVCAKGADSGGQTTGPAHAALSGEASSLRRTRPTSSSTSDLRAAAKPPEDRASEHADEAAASPAPSDVFVPNSDLDVIVPRITERPKIDGLLDDPMWARAVRLDNFCEIGPGDNVKPPCPTEALFAYDADNFYIAFICHDDSPEDIRASIADRDELFSDDFAGIMIDTFGDKQNAYELFVNPYGVQADLRRTQDSDDASFDTIWESGGKINSQGWTAEAAIPFRSLRFPDKQEQEWLVHVFRIRPRDSREQDSWAPISRDDPCLFCQAGRFRGIVGVNTGRHLELLPYAIAAERGTLKDSGDPGLGLENGDPRGEGGLGVKYGITPNLTLDFTYNPDFSQVESDAAQIDVNTTFALFYPERRPFFLEGSEIFRTDNLVYTRSVNDPTLAAKLTGKVGKFTLGYVLARDDASPFTVPFEDNSEFALGGRSVSNILRLKRDILTDSYLGLIATDRHLSDGSNSLVVADGDVRFHDNYRISGQIGYSHTKEPDDPGLSADFSDTTFGEQSYTSVFDGEAFAGYILRSRFSRDGRHVNLNVWYNDFSPTFRADNGFIVKNNSRTAGLWSGVSFRPTHPVFEVIEPQFNMGRKYNHKDVFKDAWIQPSIFIQLKKQTSVWISQVWSQERFKNVLVKGIRRVHGNIHTDASAFLSGGVFASLGRSVVRSVDVPYLGHEKVFSAWGTLKPTNRMTAALNYSYATMDSTASGPNVYSGYILRSRVSYQFNRELFLRLVTQYDSFSKILEVDPLLSYKINAFTVFYLGSTHDFADYNGQDYGGDLGYRQTDRQFFAKVQYLFRI